jgi:general secretion pathway protein H
MPGPTRTGGFTLLELLVVLVILAIIAATAVLSVGTLGRDEEIDREARRLTALLQLATEEAVFQGRDIGLYVEEDRYRFYSWSRDGLLWESLQGDSSFRERTLPEGLLLSLRVENQDVELKAAETENEIVPQVAIFSSGEITPFELTIERQFSDVRFTISGKADGVIEMSGRGDEEL